MKMFQITELDLEALESSLPEIVDQLGMDAVNNPMVRRQIHSIKTILSNVRWNYAPHTESEEFDL